MTVPSASPTCPACGDPGLLALEGCRDTMFPRDGTWRFRRCRRCESLWQDPLPAPEEIPGFYTKGYMTHRPPDEPFPAVEGFFRRSKLIAKTAVLSRAFGYSTLPNRLLRGGEKSAAALLPILPNMKRRGGYQVRYLPSVPGGRLLDAGSGNGAYLRLMRELGWSGTGIEPDPEAVAASNTAGLDVIEAGIENAPLPEAGFDAVTLHHVIEHVISPRAVLERLARTLKPGALLVSISPNPAGLLARSFGRHWSGLDAPRHITLLSPAGYRAILSPMGFEVEAQSTHQMFYWMWRESSSIRKTGFRGNSRARLVPALLSAVAAASLAILPERGEDVVCIARKSGG